MKAMQSLTFKPVTAWLSFEICNIMYLITIKYKFSTINDYMGRQPMDLTAFSKELQKPIVIGQ